MIKQTKRRIRTLTLDRETVRTLAAQELAAVAGAGLTMKCPITFDVDTACWCQEPLFASCAGSSSSTPHRYQSLPSRSFTSAV